MSEPQIINWLTVIFSSIGGTAAGGLVVAGLWKFLGTVWADRLRLQIEHDNNEKIEKLRADLQSQKDKAKTLLDAGVQKAALVTRTQFETEFNAYRELFAALVRVKLSLDSTRPQMRIASEADDERKHELLVQALNDLVKAHNFALELMATLAPFCSREVFAAVELCLNASGHEIIEIKLGGDSTFTYEWFKQGAKRKEEFNEGYQKVSNTIRERIGSLGILPQ
jgi:hypothetical protein